MKVATFFCKYDYGIKARGEGMEKAIFFPAIRDNVDEVVPFWLEDHGFPDDLDGLQNKVIDFVKREKPDLAFFILMSDEIRLETFEELSKYTVTANWFCDDQWRFDNYTKFVAPKLGYSITVDKYSLHKYNDIGVRKVVLSQWGAPFYEERSNWEGLDYKYDISFIGGKNPTREWVINELVKSGYNVQCFGAGWDGGRVSFEEMKDIFFRTKINLNLSNSWPEEKSFYQFLKQRAWRGIFDFKQLRKGFLHYLKSNNRNFRAVFVGDHKNVEQIKARNFEIPGAGGFQLSKYALEIEDYYKIGEEIAVFSTLTDLKRQIDFYLVNDKKRIDMTKKGYIRTKDYTYTKRMEKVFKEISI